MIETKQYNKVPPAMIPKLGKDEVAVFVSLHNSIGPGGVGIYPTYFIAPIATIMTEEGPVEIANVIEDAPEGKRPKMADAIFETGQKGAIVCKGSSPKDIRTFEFLSLHPENEANGGGTYRREIPGAKQQNELTKAKAEAQAINFALETPITTLKSLLLERNIKVEGRTDDDIRILAKAEGTRKLFEVQQALIPASRLDDIREMFESQVIVWDGSVKQLKNVNSQKHYDAAMRQTDTPPVKMNKLVEAAQANQVLAAQLLYDIDFFNKINQQ